eukprot:3489588-Prymnesium_polylepis.1
MPDQQAIQATKWERYDKLCEFYNGEQCFPIGEDRLPRSKWVILALQYDSKSTRADFEKKHTVELALDRGMTEEGADRDDVPEDEELDDDELD